LFHSVYAYIQKHPETLYSANATDFDAELVRHSQVDAVVQRIAGAKPGVSHLRQNPCTINRLTSPVRNFEEFMTVNGSQPAIFASGSSIAPGSTNSKVHVENIVTDEESNSLVPCLCNPESGTNFGDSHGRNMSERYCLWQYGLLPGYVLEQSGNMSNRELVDQLRFQCRLTKPSETKRLVNHVLGQLVESKRKQTRRFWKSVMAMPEGETVVWISSEDTRTPLHQDDEKQILMQLRGTKHVTIVSESNFTDDAWSHPGPFNCSKYESCTASDVVRQELGDSLRRHNAFWRSEGSTGL
jgi:hypothetical protein